MKRLRACVALVLGGLVLGLPLSALPGGENASHVLLVVGPKSHGPGEHDFPRGGTVLRDALLQAGLPLTVELVEGWPSENQLEAASAVVLYSDGLEAHVAKNRAAELRRKWEAGAGLVVLHFALEPPSDDPALRALLHDALGGAFEPDWSVNPVWTINTAPRREHPLASGVASIKVTDEWYFHLRFRADPAIDPVLLALPEPTVLGTDGPRSGNPAVRRALARGEPQVLGWTSTDAAGRRGFGFTGGHYHRNWYDDAFRTLVLNGIVWAARGRIPDGGVASVAPAAPLYPRVEESIARGDVEDVQRHLRHSPDVLTGTNRATPLLQQAILRQQPAIARVLIEAGADPDRPDRSGRTPLHTAVLRDDVDTLERLLQHGADLTRRDQQGWTPLHHAAARANSAAAQLLLARGCDPNIRSGLGGTPLHEAAASGALEVAKVLIAAGTDRNIRSDTGATAADIAREYHHPELLPLLETGASAGGNAPETRQKSP